MTRRLILGTAGHIDHGKTALIHALTGVDTDRLPEEKRRGMTIDLGFARLACGRTELGIVDVPGHERFIRNMLAGASGIDLAMLVVAADDSVMPQTREHLEILTLMGVRRGLVVLTKCDLADDDLLELVESDVAELVEGTFLDGAPIVRTSARTREGIDQLEQTLARVCDACDPPGDSDLFRLAIDRSFAATGRGTVVTGSVISGTLDTGAQVQWLPDGRTLRIRGLQSHGEDVERIHRGQRAAIGLIGANHREIARGHELATPGYLRPSRALTVDLRVLSDSPAPVRNRGRVRLHLGTGAVVATVSLPADDRLEPGRSAPAQLLTAEPVVAVAGQPFVIRRLSPAASLGGGRVLAPVARRIRRRDFAAERDRVEALGSQAPLDRAAAVVRGYGAAPWNELDLARDAGLDRAAAARAAGDLEADGRLMRIAAAHGHASVLHRDVLEALETRLTGAVESFHRDHPMATGASRSNLAATFAAAASDVAAPLTAALIDRLVEAGRLNIAADTVSLAGHEPVLTANQRAAYEKLVTTLRSAALRPPSQDELIRELGADEPLLRSISQLAVDRGELVHLGGGLFLHLEWERQMRSRVAAELAASEGLTVSRIRELLDTSRKYAVPFCEYLDRIGVTRRHGDLRIAGKPAPGNQTPGTRDHASETGAQE